MNNSIPVQLVVLIVGVILGAMAMVGMIIMSLFFFAG